MITYAAQRTSTGFTTESFSYSTDGGANFIQFADVTNIPVSFAIQTVDFAGVSALADNANAQFRVTFTGATSASGNNRLDNFQFNATAVPEPGTLLGGLLLIGTLGWNQRRRLGEIAGFLRGSCAA